MRKSKNLFVSTYLGKPVEISSRLVITSTVETEQGIVDASHPITLIGYLIASDEEFYHLGDYPNEIVQSIKKVDVAHISLLKQKTPEDALFESAPIPKNFN